MISRLLLATVFTITYYLDDSPGVHATLQTDEADVRAGELTAPDITQLRKQWALRQQDWKYKDVRCNHRNTYIKPNSVYEVSLVPRFLPCLDMAANTCCVPRKQTTVACCGRTFTFHSPIPPSRIPAFLLQNVSSELTAMELFKLRQTQTTKEYPPLHSLKMSELDIWFNSFNKIYRKKKK